MKQYDLAHLFRRQQPLMRRHSLIKSEALVDNRHNAVVGDKAQHRRKFIRRSHRRSDNPRLAKEQPHHVQSG